MTILDPNAFIGKEFETKTKGNWKCEGFAQNDTFLVVGSQFNSFDNQTEIATFKMSSVKFVGKIDHNPS